MKADTSLSKNCPSCREGAQFFGSGTLDQRPTCSWLSLARMPTAIR
jgi:hypothetical protein